MIERISNKILKLLVNENSNKQDKEILLFGITRIVEDIPKTIGIVLIGLILGIIKEIIVVTLVMMLYKTFVGGVHAKTNMGCFIYSVLFYLVTIYSAKYLCFNGYIQNVINILVYIFAVYTIVVYAPADVPEIPKVDENLRRTLKTKSMISLNLIYMISIFIINNQELRMLIIYSVFYISVMTTRTIYRLFKAEYGYECYIPDELI